MNTDEVFTDAINYRLVAQLLLRAGYTAVPSMEIILILTAKEEDTQLLRWVKNHCKDSPDILSGMTALYMQRK